MYIFKIVSFTCSLSLSPLFNQHIFLQDYTTRTSRVNKKELAENISNHVVLLFSSEKCVVSEGAKQLMELVHQTLKVSLVQPATRCLFSAVGFPFSICLSQIFHSKIYMLPILIRLTHIFLFLSFPLNCKT